MSLVGIIANPASGKDIRRLVAHSITFNNLEKVNIVKRAILGLNELGVEKVVYMPDYYGIVPRVLDSLPSDCRLSTEISVLDMEMTGLQEDSTYAAMLMQQIGVDCIITLGGDGTNRMVAKGCGKVPLLPISTGTNNVFPRMLEGTTAGMAAGIIAKGLVNTVECVKRSKRLEVLQDGKVIDIALIDAVVLNDLFIGSRAVWDEQHIRQVVVTRAEPDCIGMSAIAGNLEPVGISEKRGMAVTIGPGNITVHAPIGPGLIRPVPICDYKILQVGEEVQVNHAPCVIALDGEREIEVSENGIYAIKLSLDGPGVIDVRQTLWSAVVNGYSRININ